MEAAKPIRQWCPTADGLTMAEDCDDDGESDGCFGCGHRHDEHDEDLPCRPVKT
jgi:hypothetical protein